MKRLLTILLACVLGAFVNRSTREEILVYFGEKWTVLASPGGPVAGE